MERVSSDHIDPTELAKLLEEARNRSSHSVDAASLHPHFDVCVPCKEQFENLESLDHQLRSLKPPGPARRQPDCPDPAVWRNMAGGLTPADATLVCIEHASWCDHCGTLLRQAVGEVIQLNGEITDAERKHIASLESASEYWQQTLARRIVRTTRFEPEPRTWWRRLLVPWQAGAWQAGARQAGPHLPARLAIAGVSLAAVVGVGSWLLVQRNQPAAADQLLARAYTEQRTLELRIQGADHAPLRVSLGLAASFTGRPPALLKAEALIASKLESHPSDPSWLEAKAKADVLEGKYEGAVESLRRALELNPHSPTLLTDLATAYFQRSQQEDRKEDLGAAYEYLSQALKLSPDDPVALFNRAIVAEHQFLYHQALDDWEHYLRLDPGSQWAEEARTRVNAVREKLKEHGSATPLLSPAQVAAMVSSARLGPEIDQRIEEYLHEAVRAWLPQAFPEAGVNETKPPETKSTADPNAAQALFFLADLTSQQHGDQWLSDLLRGSSAPHFSQAANALARAVKANDAGDYGVSRKQAELAERLFRISGNTAGVLRAEFEQAFEAQISRRSEECRRRSIAAGAEARRYSYPWVQIQLGLEESVCSLLMGDLGTYEKIAHRAEDRAQLAGYGALYLRALYFVADSKFNTGDQSGGWKLVCTGLERFWSGQFPARRGFNLYTDLTFIAKAEGRANLEVAIWREAVVLIDSDEELLQRAMTHSFMADAATTARLPEFAEQQYTEAARLFAAAPRTEASRGDALETRIRIARLEAYQGRFDDAIARLTAIQDKVRALSNNYLAQIFYSTLGEVELRSNREKEAVEAFRLALRLAEQNLASLTSEASRTSWSNDAAPVYLGLAEAKLVQGREQEALDVFEWYLGAAQRVGMKERATPQHIPKSSESLPDSSHLSARLPLLSQQTVLAYGVLPDGLAIWVYDNRGVTAKWVPKSTQELQDLASDFYAECSDPNSDLSALRRDSQTLYSQLIAPVEQQLDPNRTLVIETEGFLNRLPFEALIDASGHYLIERGPIVYSPGLYAEARMHPDIPISPDLPALVVGSSASSADAGLFAIPNIPAGADTVASGFHSPRVLKGTQATLSAVTSALPAAAVFHFAGHAITTPTHTGLLLEGQDKRTGAPLLLDASLVRKLNLQNMQLAVLAACSTDSGEGSSRGFDSVAETLQTSGVPHVVASRWPVDSVEASVFANYFYGSLLSGDSVSNATRLTARKMLLNPHTSHPYYWAAFAAYGRP